MIIIISTKQYKLKYLYYKHSITSSSNTTDHTGSKNFPGNEDDEPLFDLANKKIIFIFVIVSLNNEKHNKTKIIL